MFYVYSLFTRRLFEQLKYKYLHNDEKNYDPESFSWVRLLNMYSFESVLLNLQEQMNMW